MQCRQVMHRRALNPFYHLSPLPSQRIEPLQSLYCPHYYPPSLPFLASLHLKAIICNPFLPRVSIIRSSQVIFMGFSKCYNDIHFVHYCQGGFTA